MIIINILRTFLPCVFVLSSTFCSDVFVSPNGTNIHNSALLYCTSENMQKFGYSTSMFDKSHIEFWKRNNISISYTEYMKMIDFNIASKKLFKLYYILDLCRSFYVLDKSYYTIFDEISYESLPDNCKKLLSENIKELKKKCDIKVAQKLSVLTAINTQWEDALSAMKEIANNGVLSHKYTLTEALFVLHLNPEQPSIIIRTFESKKCDEDVLFYAKCLTGALACVLKYEKKIPSDFEFDLAPCSDTKLFFYEMLRNLCKHIKIILLENKIE